MRRSTAAHAAGASSGAAARARSIAASSRASQTVRDVLELRDRRARCRRTAGRAWSRRSGSPRSSRTPPSACGSCGARSPCEVVDVGGSHAQPRAEAEVAQQRDEVGAGAPELVRADVARSRARRPGLTRRPGGARARGPARSTRRRGDGFGGVGAVRREARERGRHDLAGRSGDLGTAVQLDQLGAVDGEVDAPAGRGCRRTAAAGR